MQRSASAARGRAIPLERAPGAVRRALVVLKQSTVDRAERPDGLAGGRMRELIRHDDHSVAEIRASHAEHTASAREVRRRLRARGVHVTERTELPARPIRGYDLVVAVGGDGMVLGVSHAVRDDTPVLGVNSAPSFSVGFLSGCTAAGLDATLDAFEAGRLRPVEVQRLQVRVGGQALGEPVLNDVLFCADNPAMMSRYVLIWPDGEEVQRSSGVWVSTPAGSTSALASAGGPILPIAARQFAFLVREPYAPPGVSVRYRSAVLDESQVLRIESRTLEASVFVDGTHRRRPVLFGEVLEVGLHPQPLHLVRQPR